MNKNKFTIAALVALIASAMVSCSSSDDGSNSTNRTPPFANGMVTGGAGSGTGGAGSGTGATSGAGGTSGDGTGSGSDGSVDIGSICGMGTASADLAPVNMLVMFDRSQSMNDNNKWTNATAALTSFFQNPGAAGLRVALRFFPHDSPAAGCNDQACDATACSQPLVDIGELTADPAPTDAQEGLLVNAISMSAPGNGGGQGTPMYAALDGALQWAMNYKNAHPTETTVLIFVTDGEPRGCDENFDNIAALAANALASAGVPTYAIGLEGSSMAQMDQLATEGGTGPMGIYIGNSANAEQELLDALNAIRGQTLSCNLLMPKPADPSVPVDPTKVNLTYTQGSTGMTYTLAQVADANACGDSPSWHYDDNTNPMSLILCPAACDMIANDSGATLEILLGCGTCGVDDPNCAGTGGGSDIPPVLK